MYTYVYRYALDTYKYVQSLRKKKKENPIILWIICKEKNQYLHHARLHDKTPIVTALPAYDL